MRRSRTATEPSPASGYHHGDLREALVRAGVEILEEQGLAALTLREVARRANVSHAAPYHHFPNKEALLTAIAARGLRMQSEEMALAMANPKPSTDGLQSFGMAYVAFAAAHPSLFRLMYSHERTGPNATKELADATASIDVRFIEGIREKAKCSVEHARSIALLLWASMHGLAMLWLDGQLQWEGAPPLESLAFQVTELLGANLRPPSGA